MADTLKILGQLATAATTEATLYTVPAATSAIVSTLTVCNRGTSATTFRIAFDQGGGGVATKDYLYYDHPIRANETFAATMGITLAATDLVRVYAGNSDLTFQAFGLERA